MARVFTLALLWMGFAWHAGAAEPAPPVAEAGEPPPAEFRAFLDAARQADAIADPLARCLAFPDLPGNHWPKDLARRHCEFEYGPRITRARIAAALDGGDVAGLDAAFAADLARHFSDEGFSEAIHRDFDDIEADAASARLTERWLAAAPASPYALAARGWFYTAQSQQARGTRYVGKTPDEDLRRMSELSTLAVEQFERALAIEPRLLPAWVGLMDVARRDSRAELFSRAEREALALDAACVRVARQRMFARQPRWGGSHEEMATLAGEYRPLMDRRPLLALATFQPQLDAAQMLRLDDGHAQAIAGLQPIVLESTDPEAPSALAGSLIAVDAAGNRWPALEYLLAAGRFDEHDAWANRERGRALLVMHEPAWAQRYLARAVADAPDHAEGHQLYASSLFLGRRFAESEAEYLLAMQDPEVHRGALNDLVRAMAAMRSVKAVTYSDQLVRESPENPDSWGVRAYALKMRGISTPEQARAAIEALERFLSLTEGTSDPRHLRERVRATEDLARLREVLQKMGT